MFRALVLLLGLLLVPLSPVPAAAIVVACPNGFNNCDPYSGTCYTAWTAALAGMVQANCSADPAACWVGSLTSPACDDPIPPPVNPNAFRVCPFGADCGVGFPPHPIDQYAPGVRAQPGRIIYSYLGIAPSPLPPCCDPPTLDAMAALDDFLGTLINGPGAPDGHGGFWPHFSQWTRLVPVSVATFEPAPSCGWTIAPTAPVQPCVLPEAALIAAMKQDSPTQWTGLNRYRIRLNARVDKLGTALANGRFGSPASQRYAAKVNRLVWLIDLAALITRLHADPPNPNYQSFPGPGVFPPLTPLTPDATLTQAEITALQAWLSLQREVVITGRQLTDTIDNLAGALLAADAGTPGAATWVRDLAVHADTTLAILVTKGLAEIGARAALVAAGPSIAVPAGSCATPTSAANVLRQAVQHGNSLYEGHLLYQGQLVTCGAAISDPAWMATDVAEDTALWNSFATFSVAAYLCTANPAYCAGGAPIATIAPTAIAFGTWPLGALSPINLFTVSNGGTTSLVIGSASLGGVDASQFVKTGPKDLCSGTTLAAGATCTIGVKFQPTTVGVKTATLQVPSNAPTVSATVTGTGSGNVGVSPASIAFGALPVGTLSTIRFATVTNTGTVTMTMGTIGISGASASQFIKTNPKDLCSGKTLIPGATCTLGIKFWPTSLGAKTAILNIAASTGAVSVILTGTGI